MEEEFSHPLLIPLPDYVSEFIKELLPKPIEIKTITTGEPLFMPRSPKKKKRRTNI